ncbi:Extracellular matrix protein FRAS1 [Holothuria leucospilota]|uniref:Extracellular matrix protein FRAS1 n=1 Tax=Holothuria leucospilota TaxID=206669 RepID=A0A9Q0YGF8_HOLLE|nr:Extracellular matrix protein FRAS1 [Holothuria leucospilota]
MLRLCFINVLLLSMPRGGTAQVYEETEQFDSASQSESFSGDYPTYDGNNNPCSFRGQFLTHTQSITLDPCTKCTCRNGTTTCNVPGCPVLPCPPAERIITEGECCDHCAGTPVEEDCDVGGLIVPYKHQWHLRPCTVCTCGNYGRYTCHDLLCPSSYECDVSELYRHRDLCCPLCPYKMVVKSVRISHIPEFTFSESSSHTVRFSLHVAVAKRLSSATVQGENMWRLAAWMSENEDGSGVRMSFYPNIFNEENAAKPFHHRNPSNFKWPELEYSTEPLQTPCARYLCVEFDQQDDPSPRYDLSFTFQARDNERRRLVDCISYSNCYDLTPKMHNGLTIKRILERKLGDAIIFECNVTNAHTIWWKHSSWAETERVSSSSTFRIDNITLADQGCYYCHAKGHGQHIRSAGQILIIPGMLQFLLTIKATIFNPSSLQDMAIYQMHITNKLEEANVLVVSLNASTETNASFYYLNTELKLGQKINNITRNVQSIVEEATKSAPVSNSPDVTIRLEGLSLCVEDLITTEVGNLSFPSVSLNTETVSNEHCIVPRRLPRGSRRCEGELVTAARWTDLQIRNCFNSSTTEETNSLIDSFFEIIKKGSLTISDVPYISGDLVDITKAKTIGKEDITHISSVLNMISSFHSTSPLVTSNALHTVDQIMEASKVAPSVDGQLSITTTSRILESVELQLENFQKRGENFALLLPNIEVKFVQIPHLDEPISFAVCLSSNRKDEKVSNVNEHNPGCKNGAYVYIPSVVMNLPKKDLNQKVIPVTFTSYESDVLFNDEKSRKDNKRLNSIIISASTSNEVDQLPKGSFIRTTFYPLSANRFNSKFTCVFWDHILYEESGGWSSEGCHNEEANGSFVYICKCDQFGNIAVLVDLTNDMKVRSNNTVFVVFITAIIILVATICTYLAIKAVQHAWRRLFRYQENATNQDGFEPLELHS